MSVDLGGLWVAVQSAGGDIACTPDTSGLPREMRIMWPLFGGAGDLWRYTETSSGSRFAGRNWSRNGVCIPAIVQPLSANEVLAEGLEVNREYRHFRFWSGVDVKGDDVWHWRTSNIPALVGTYWRMESLTETLEYFQRQVWRGVRELIPEEGVGG